MTVEADCSGAGPTVAKICHCGLIAAGVKMWKLFYFEVLTDKPESSPQHLRRSP